MIGIRGALFATFVAGFGAADLRPPPREAILRVGEHELAPVAVWEEAFTELAVGSSSLRFGEGWIARMESDGVERWRVPLELTDPPRWLGAVGGCGLFAACDGSVERLDLESGAWLEPFVHAPAPDGSLSPSPVGVLDVDGTTWLLVRWCEGGSFDAQLRGSLGVATGWSVAAYPPQAVRPAWVHGEPARPPRETLVHVLMTPGKARVEPLVRTEGGVVVCAGVREDLVCLTEDCGDVVWRLERVWEYERGLVGASACDHIVGRFGQDERFPAQDREAELAMTARRRREFDENFSCRMVAGPVVVTRARARPFTTSQQSLLIAVERAPLAGSHWRAPAECRVYEFGVDGRPLSMAPLSRCVEGKEQHVEHGAVVWAGPSTSFVRCAPTKNTDWAGSGRGGPDAVTHVEWFRELAYDPPRAWLRRDPARDVVAFDDRAAWRPAAGMYVLERHDPIAQFPLWRVELESGAARVCTVEVSMTRLSPEAEIGARRSPSAEMHEWWKVRLTDLAVIGGRLRATITGEDFTNEL